MDPIYLLYTCDIHKSWASMRLHVATTNESVLLDCLKDCLKANIMAYNCSDEEDEQCYSDTELDALDQIPFGEINVLLDYGYIQTVVDGETQ